MLRGSGFGRCSAKEGQMNSLGEEFVEEVGVGGNYATGF